MKLHIPFACIMLLCSYMLPAQLVVAGMTKDDYHPPLYLTDMSGKAIPASNNSDIAGTPLLSDDWNLGYVKLDVGRKVDSVQLKFNVEENRLLFLRNGESFEFVDAIREFSFSFNNKDRLKQVVFRNNYPEVDNNNQATYYEVLAEGPRVQLLQHTKKKITESYVYNGPSKRQYEDAYTLYVYDSVTKKIQKIKAKRSSVTGALPELEAAIDKLCSQNNWDLKSIDELKLLVQVLKY